jgi:uronate dehydrogenase
MAKVVVTGSAGRLGRAAVRGLLQGGHDVTGLDLRPTPGLPAERSIVAGLHDVAVLHAVLYGADALVHLAATPDDLHFPRTANEPDNFLSELASNNLAGLYRVLEVSRWRNVPRVILASTGQVIDRHLDAGRVPVNAATPYAPRYWYASTKVFLEAAGMAYAAQHGLEILAVRLGWCPRDEGQVRQIETSPEDQDVYLSPNDAGRFFERAVAAKPWGGFRAVYATSKPVAKTLYELDDVTELTGFEPMDTWPIGARDFR